MTHVRVRRQPSLFAWAVVAMLDESPPLQHNCAQMGGNCILAETNLAQSSYMLHSFQTYQPNSLHDQKHPTSHTISSDTLKNDLKSAFEDIESSNVPQIRGVEVFTAHEPSMGGGFADIYEGAYHGHRVAVKRIRVHAIQPSMRQSLSMALIREAVLWFKCKHDSITPLIGLAQDIFPGNLVLVMPWMDQGDFRSYMRSRNVWKETPAVCADVVRQWIVQIVSGLAYMHAKYIVHGDLHTKNVLVDSDGTLKLTDMGHSTISDGTPLAYASVHGGGLINFTAPELLDPPSFGRVNARPTHESDIYSFACIVFEIFAGHAPFHDCNFCQIIRKVVDEQRKPSRPATYPRGCGIY
ncbi:kinase-like domain-containing protein [Cristinia sonorae]|uniref:Kinase-like domain-containing protein n=1 Tax=Cristinia sonorae TaxID=1940300 RepID=A0A8K0XQW5_9AGAR|nr:kinase-like domain-containing protein [Cristinia sonorae]